MNFFRNLPVRRKLTIANLVTCAVVLVLACAALFAFQISQLRQNFTRDLSALGEMLADASSAAVAFQDENRAREILATVKAKPLIVCACINLTDGTSFAHYGVEDDSDELDSQSISAGIRDDGGRMLLTRPIVLDKKHIGTLYLRADFQRTYRDLIRVYGSILAVVLVVSMSIGLMISGLFQGVISEPILKLARTARAIAENRDYSVRAPSAGRDEVGVLTDAFNRMLSQIELQDLALQQASRELQRKVEVLKREISAREETESKLETAHNELVRASRQAGMAEVATSVLHNVGNVLTSVNVSASLVMDRLRKDHPDKLARTVGLIQDKAHDLTNFVMRDPKGGIALGYLHSLAQHMKTERIDCVQELDSLVKNIQHIKEIVAMQQSYAKVGGVIERLPAADLVEDALRMSTAALKRHRISIERQFKRVPPVAVDKHKVLQILVNLISNAKHAMTDTPLEAKRLVLAIEPGGPDRIRIIVRDHGVGIPRENLTRVFSQGFTTKKDGHGFGLHSSAIAAQEMGGTLTAESEGPGQGATFTLELSCQPDPAVEASPA